MARYVALLRGINVGGKNPIRMSDLKAAFEADGYGNVATYIQSGNVLFDTGRAGSATLAERIERMLAEAFDHYAASVVVRSLPQMRSVVQHAPAGFGGDPARFRYDVIFLKEPLTAREAITSVPTKPGVDQVHGGRGVLYFSRLTSKATQSRLSRVVSLPIYQQMTIRNWNTTTKLLGIMQRS